ncbi:MAG: hypothetical protein RJA70_3381 [Pseudomonadota bacterium]
MRNVALPLYLSVFIAGVAAACGQSDPKTPGLEGMGAPGISWAAKNKSQQYGYMAAVVHPEMQKVFASYDDSYAEEFTCETCHGSDAELRDYKMPNDEIYSLPAENTIAEALDYDEDVTNAMMAKVVPGLKKLLDQGEGTKATVDCFSCHVKE